MKENEDSRTPALGLPTGFAELSVYAILTLKNKNNMKSERFVDIHISVNNLMAIIDILEAYETEFRFQNIDFDKFLSNFGWTREEYMKIYDFVESILNDSELQESYNYCHTWEYQKTYETNNNQPRKR